MLFPKQDRHWSGALNAALKCAGPDELIFAPNCFLEFFRGTLPYHLLDRSGLEKASWLLLNRHSSMDAVAPLEEKIRSLFVPVYANRVFVLFGNRNLDLTGCKPRFNLPFAGLMQRRRVDAFWKKAAGHRARFPSAPPSLVVLSRSAAMITTYNRPWALARSLPQVLKTGCPVAVVNDGSDAAYHADYEKIRNQHDSVHWIELPGNRGLSCALNTGLSYWLADPEIEWISCYQDDDDVHPGILEFLEKVQDSRERPLLSGRLSPEHPVVAKSKINGVEVCLCHSTSAQHLHAHRDYWAAMLPLPSMGLGRPKPGLGSNCDWWIGSWAPDSVCKAGKQIVCLPGLVSTFATHKEDSTWGNEPSEDMGIHGIR